ncbi:hypothetical protein [Mycobacterium sp. AZCC_0083]|uniref:hypothetical protein n=1 Tax=Mycobacterium sp. AZCC_0083 TaxID=2735882 RepID=UPI001612780B|nr:hypothetical protein [Mycobacterium sp. AZCC_0083]MBB5161571.1 hypothetical protein [Mycobacterium sp. AZCC_0083]
MCFIGSLSGQRCALKRTLGHGSAKVILDVDASLFDADLDEVAIDLHTTCARDNVGA